VLKKTEGAINTGQPRCNIGNYVECVIIAFRQVNNIWAISWRDQVTPRCADVDVCFVL